MFITISPAQPGTVSPRLTWIKGLVLALVGRAPAHVETRERYSLLREVQRAREAREWELLRRRLLSAP